MLHFISNFLKSLKIWEYFHPSSFWVFAVSSSLCFNTFQLASFSENLSQAQVVIKKVRAGDTQQHVNSVANLDKKKYFKKMLVRHFPDCESRVYMEQQQAIIYQKAVKKIKEYKRISPLLNNYQNFLTD